MDIVKEKSTWGFVNKHIGSVITVSAIVLTIIITVGLSASDNGAPTVEKEALLYGQVQQGDLSKEITASGILAPEKVRWLTAVARAEVVDVLVKPGTKVKEDTVLLTLKSTELDEELKNARWEWEEASSSLVLEKSKLNNELLALKVNLEKLKSDYESARVQMLAEKEIAEKGIIPKVMTAQSDIKVKNLKRIIEIEKERFDEFTDSIKVQLQVRESRVDLYKSRYESVKQKHDLLTVKAGMNGIVQVVSVVEGHNVEIGNTLVNIADNNSLIAELRIPETQGKDVVIGYPVEVDLRSEVVMGKVSRIDPQVINNTVKVDVRFDKTLPNGARPDLSVDGTIKIAELNNVMFIKKPSAIAENANAYVFVVDEDGGNAVRRRVNFGAASSQFIQVKSGLELGDKIIISDVSRWIGSENLTLD
ncbi:efflux RND transporter periplasmic adaptor subunit [Alteromonas sp. a30]|uniref:efflux RND transporter periplasmic adaptor subunit n=1 Tax=Alteromonas sp. a30 TaxID=2730917 RepID=UPI00227F2842|nr:efflux RND transporter periplasmic adaptor subunit [Alteromonas sp. a30]MCY7294913.1 HlyD family efflux transporter periplasmic adaptor subunit [Alteromonas sp. a30]